MTAAPGETVTRFGRPFRHYPLAVSAESLALAWARQEQAPPGATVLVDREVSSRGRGGRVWDVPAETTLAFATVLRPTLAAEEADAVWLVGGSAAAAGAEAASGQALATWWPDLVVDRATGERVGAVKAEAQLGPGEVRSAVVTVRLHLGALAIEPARRDEVLEAVLESFGGECRSLATGAAGAAAAYSQRCRLLGRRVKLTLLPKGETRGLARAVDPTARLELESSTGMVERIPIDTLRELEVV